MAILNVNITRDSVDIRRLGPGRTLYVYLISLAIFISSTIAFGVGLKWVQLLLRFETTFAFLIFARMQPLTDNFSTEASSSI